MCVEGVHVCLTAIHNSEFLGVWAPGIIMDRTLFVKRYATVKIPSGAE
jgi:hypothetical protein